MKKFANVFELETTKNIKDGETLYYNNAWLVISKDGTKTRRLID